MALNMITDRSTADVATLKAIRAKLVAGGWSSLSAAEQATWTAGKGANNATDLNRVESAVAYLAGILSNYGYPVQIATTVVNWTEGDATTDPSEFTADDAARYLANVAAIKAAFYGATALPATLGSIGPEDLNNIERVLLEVEANVTRMSAAFRYCGELICGEDQ